MPQFDQQEMSGQLWIVAFGAPTQVHFKIWGCGWVLPSSFKGFADEIKLIARVVLIDMIAGNSFANRVAGFKFRNRLQQPFRNRGKLFDEFLLAGPFTVRPSRPAPKARPAL